jgi:hypothetical protein
VEQCFSPTANQPQPAYKPKNSLPNRAQVFFQFQLVEGPSRAAVVPAAAVASR